MNKAYLLATAAATAILFAGAPSVQAQGGLVGINTLDDRIDTIRDDTDQEFRRSQDANRFGNQVFGPGWTGSVSASGSVVSGNIESTDFTLAGRVRSSLGPWNQTLGLAGEYGKDRGIENQKSIFAVYDVNRSLSDRLYVFALARAQYDEFAAFRRDAFFGVGPGIRIFNTPTLAWRVQAGPGVRFTEANGTGDDTTEFGAIASSFFYYKLADNIFMTNDTDVLYSDTTTLISNDLGLNLRVSDLITTRVGYRTEYTTDPTPGFEDTDNKLSAALVFAIR